MDLFLMGQRIRKQREFLGYTRENMAEKLQCSTKFCADIENGASGISLKNLLLLSDFLKLSTDYILKGSDEKSEIGNINAIIGQCPQEKVDYLEEIIKIFIKSC
ncbi:MAG: helix-turn-helix transcriptional regulator [Oscillospiraceae bacterium]